MESQKLPESSDLEPLKSVAFSVRFIAKKMMKWVLESMENRCNEWFISIFGIYNCYSFWVSFSFKENKIPVQGSQRWYSDCTAAGCRPDASIIFLRFCFAGCGPRRYFGLGQDECSVPVAEPVLEFFPQRTKAGVRDVVACCCARRRRFGLRLTFYCNWKVIKSRQLDTSFVGEPS